MNLNDEYLRKTCQNLASQINLSNNQERTNILTEKFLILLKNGFDENLLRQMVPKFFVEKGFSISESLLIAKNKQSLHPTIEEIQRLTKDEQTNILKLEYLKPNLDVTINYQYILVIGPPKQGKTTVIFNLINAIYNVRRDSLYRVTKAKDQSNKYYDEYFIQISDKDCYVFVEFKGIGDVKLDFLGLDLSGKNNLFMTILQYVQNKTILSILYVNSSSINSLGICEIYQLQRFFEILPKAFLNRIHFILPYCTDSHPLLYIYISNLNSAVPEEMKQIMRNWYKSEKLDNIHFGINNAYLYEKINYRTQSEYQNNSKIDVQAVIDGQQYLEVEIQREEGTLLEQNNFQDNNNEDYDIEIPVKEYENFLYNQMVSTAHEILQKINHLRPLITTSNEVQMFQKTLEFEQEIAKLLQIKQQLSKTQFPYERIEFEQPSNYLNYAQYSTHKFGQNLYCTNCDYVCHKSCSLQQFSQIYENQEFCHKLIDNRTKPYENFLIQQVQIQCKSCLKKNNNCTLKTHILVDKLPYSCTIGKIDIIKNNNFNSRYFNQKKSKKILLLKQTNIFNLSISYLNQVNKIQNEQKLIQSQDGMLAKMNLQKRTILINAIYKQLTNNQQDENQDFLYKLLALKEIYNKIDPPQYNFYGSNTILLTCCFHQDLIEQENFDQFEIRKKQNASNSFSEFPEIQNESVAQIDQTYLAQHIFQNNMKRFYEQQQQQNERLKNNDRCKNNKSNFGNGQLAEKLGQEAVLQNVQK